MLKNHKHKQQKAVIAFIFFGLLISAGCGKRKPPLPPLERIPQRIELSGTQRGNQIIIRWLMPARNASPNNLLNITRADIYRLIESSENSQTISEEDFVNQSTLIASVPINDSDFARKEMLYTDLLTFSGQIVRIRYALRFVNANGQKAGFSNFIILDPATNIAKPPTNLTSKVSQEFISLNWNPPIANINESSPANILGFNIYRSDEEVKQTVINKTPVSGNNFEDRFFEFEKSYRYSVRTVSLGSNGEPIESLNSETITVSPKDIFPPIAPSAVTIAASPSTISIFFATNPEKDIAGYRVYRSNDRNLPQSEWILLTQELLQTNTFQDTDVQAGKTYFYYLTAVDKFGNISPFSEIVGETIP